jgi:cytochrome c-type biogenesis protein CcmH/NrfG
LQDVSAAQGRPVTANLPRGAENASDEGADADDAERPADAESESTPLITKQVGMVIGGAVLAVIVLFAATTWSQQMEWGTSSTEPAAPMASSGAASAQPSTAPTDLETLVRENATDSIPEPLRRQIATLEDEIAQQTGEGQRARQQELVNLYIGAGRLGQAALVQRRIAEASGDPDAWRRTGDFLYSWMETFEGQQPASSSVAEHVVTAYQNVLEQQPGNLDVRTDMATAFLQTNQPMRGVEAINRVLEEDPDHFQARFNKGIMLTMIGRAEEAIQQFERVKEIVGTDSPYHQQAEQAIQTIRQRMRSDNGSS